MVEELRVLKRMIEDNRGPYMYFLFLSQAVASIPPPTGEAGGGFEGAWGLAF